MTNLDPGEAGDASARLVEKIREELGEGWTKLPGLEGTEKNIVVWDDSSVSLVAGNYAFWQRPSDGALICLFAKGAQWYEGDWTSGTFEIHGMGPLSDPRLN